MIRPDGRERPESAGVHLGSGSRIARRGSGSARERQKLIGPVDEGLRRLALGIKMH
jgi:hypothetical protein